MRIVHAAGLLLLLLGTPVHGNDSIRYVFAELGSDGAMDYRLDGKNLKEDQLPAYFRENRKKWPLAGVEIRVVFRGTVSLDWFGYACRSFRIRGFQNIRCFAGNDDTGKAIEMHEKGQLVQLPGQRW